MAKWSYYFRRRRKRRTFFYRYTYRKYRSYANRVRLNYYRAKIDLFFCLFKQLVSGSTTQWDWYFGTEALGNPSKELILQNKIRDNAEYKLYIPIYNEVKLTGVQVRILPSGQEKSLTNHKLPFIYFTYDNATTSPMNTPMLPNPLEHFVKYFKNINSHWLPIAQTAADIQAEHGIRGRLFIDSEADGQGQTASQIFYIQMACYFKFRKNKNN